MQRAVGLREGLAAGRSGEGEVAWMGACVIPQSAGVREGLAAGGANVGAVAGMGALVSRQLARLGEHHAAGGADIGADAGMGAHVSREVAGLRAGLAAEGALNYGVASSPVPPPPTQPIRSSIRCLSRKPFPSPLASGHRHIKRIELRPSGAGWSKKTS